MTRGGVRVGCGGVGHWQWFAVRYLIYNENARFMIHAIFNFLRSASSCFQTEHNDIHEIGNEMEIAIGV